jgi:hypothetical protein
LFAAVSLLAIASIVLLATSLTWLNKKDPLERIEDELAQGRSVTLIPEKGPPAYSRWLGGPGSIQESANSDGTFSYISLETSLLELVRNPRTKQFRFSAEVRHDDSARLSDVGVYFGRVSQTMEVTVESCLFTLTFNDHEALFKRFQNQDLMMSQVHLSLRNPPDSPTQGGMPLRAEFFNPTVRTSGQFPWRKLEVVVRPDALEATWEGGQSLEKIPLQDILQGFQSFKNINLKNTAGPAGLPEYEPQSSLGLIVQRGGASFRNVAVTPLD